MMHNLVHHIHWVICGMPIVLLREVLTKNVGITGEMRNSSCSILLPKVIRAGTKSLGKTMDVVTKTEIQWGLSQGSWIFEFDGT